MPKTIKTMEVEVSRSVIGGSTHSWTFMKIWEINPLDILSTALIMTGITNQATVVGQIGLRRTITRGVIDMTKHPGGRPPHFSTPEQLLTSFDEWKEALSYGNKLYGEIPDVEGFCDFVGAYRQLLMEYEKKPEFSTTIKKIKNWIYYRKKQMAMQGKMNAAVFIFDAKNNAGYVDRQEMNARVEQVTPILGGKSIENTTSDIGQE
jgi:hypothetical protein